MRKTSPRHSVEWLRRSSRFILPRLSLFSTILSNDQIWLMYILIKTNQSKKTLLLSRRYDPSVFCFCRSVYFQIRKWIGSKPFIVNYGRKIDSNTMFMLRLLNIVSHCQLNALRIESAVDLDNRLIENYSVTLVRCTEQERDILTLRQENTDLQKNSARWEDWGVMSSGCRWFSLQRCRSSSERQSEKLRKWLYESQRWNSNSSARTNRCNSFSSCVVGGWLDTLSFL